MRRFQALLIAAGMAAAPAGALAGPSHGSGPRSGTVQTFEWSTSRGRLGVMVMSLTPELRTYFGVAKDRGVLVAHVEPGTPAAAAGLAAGDVIIEVRGQPIESAADVLTALADVHKGQHVAVQLVRDHQPRSVEATLSNDPLPAMFDTHGSGMNWLRHLMDPTAPPDHARAPFEDDWFRDFRELFHPPKASETSLHT